MTGRDVSVQLFYGDGQPAGCDAPRSSQGSFGRCQKTAAKTVHAQGKPSFGPKSLLELLSSINPTDHWRLDSAIRTRGPLASWCGGKKKCHSLRPRTLQFHPLYLRKYFGHRRRLQLFCIALFAPANIKPVYAQPVERDRDASPLTHAEHEAQTTTWS